MDKIVDFKKASSFYLIGTLFNKGIGFITVPIFTRILTLEDYGIVTTYNSWVSILMVFMSLALYMAIRSSFVDYNGETQKFLSVITSFTCAYGCAFSAIVLAILYILPININIGLVALCLLQALSTAIIEDVSMFLMMRYQYKARTAIMVLPNLLSTIIAIVIIKFVLNTDLYLGRVIPNVIITLLFGTFALFYALRGAKERFYKPYLVYALKISIPLVFHGIALNILSQSDRTMISAIRNNAETGIYGLIYNFSMIATVITISFDGIWIPYFTNNMNERRFQKINQSSIKYIEFMTMAMISVVLLGPEIVKLLATEEYWEGISIIPPIVLANYVIFLYTMYVNVEHYYKKTFFISVNTTIAALSNIVLNFFFISRWGYVGAAYTTLISYLLALGLHFYYARKLNNELFPIKQFMLPCILITGTVFVFYIFTEFWLIRWLFALGITLFLAIKEREYIKEIIVKDRK